MFDKNYIPYLVQLVIEDKRKMIKPWQEIGDIKQIEKVIKSRDDVIKALNDLFDDLNS